MKQEDVIKRLQLVYRSMLLGQVIFGVIAFVMLQQGLMTPGGASLNRPLQVAAVLAALLGVAGGIYWYTRKIKLLRDSSLAVPEKLKQYQQHSLIKWAMAEAPVLFCLIGYMLTGNISFAVFALLLMFVFAGFFPSRQKIMQELGCSETDLP